MPDFAEIQTDRLRLSTASLADLDELEQLLEEQAQHLGYDAPDRTYVSSLLNSYEDDWHEHRLGYWTVRDPEDGYLGIGGARLSVPGPEGGLWNLYYHLSRTARGHGYAVAVADRALECVAALDPGALVQAWIRPDNSASVAVATKAGLRFSHRQPDHAGIEHLVMQAEIAFWKPVVMTATR